MTFVMEITYYKKEGAATAEEYAGHEAAANAHARAFAAMLREFGWEAYPPKVNGKQVE